jgi:Family of unknown function (DUF6069)
MPTTLTSTNSRTVTSIIGTDVASAAAGPRSIWRPGVVAGLAAAAVATLIAVAARAADIPVAVGGETIPLMGFGQFTFVGALLGIGLAKCVTKRASHADRTFARATVVLTAVSIVPDALADATTATKVVLALTHVAAAAIIIPVLSHRLAD